MKALITGQAGFVGGYLAEHLVTAGDTVVPFTDSSGEAVDVVNADAVHDSITRHDVDVVYHLAALTHVGESWDAPASVWRVNTEGTMNVLQAAARVGARVLVISSADAYGRIEPGTPITEDAPLRPLSPYGASKAAAELIAVQAWRSSGTAAIVVRAFNHTGPGQSPRFVVPALAARVVAAERAGLTDIVVGNLDAVRDLSDVRDVVAAYRNLAVHGDPGEAYNVSSGQPLRVRDIAEKFIAAAGGGMELVVDPDLVRPVDVPWLVGDPGKLRASTPWLPRFTLDETLGAILQAARDTAPG